MEKSGKMERIAKILDPQIQFMIDMARAQYGDALQAVWFNESEACPGCGGEITPLRRGGKQSISLNGFFHQPAGVLIGYILCGNCAAQIHRAARRNPNRLLPLHRTIEENLVADYTANHRKPSA